MVYKNLIIISSALIFMVLFWSYNEFVKSHSLINRALDPVLSIERGRIQAGNDFVHKNALFKVFNDNVPGVTDEELEDKFKSFAPYTGFMCGYGSYLGDIRLDLDGYKYNLYYVHSYNSELRRLIESDF